MKRLAMQVFKRLPRLLRRLIIRLVTPSYSVGAVLVMVREDGRILLVEQRHSPGWALPGGLLNRGESAADGVVREVAEEVGLAVDPATLPVPNAVIAPVPRRVDIVYVVRAGAGADSARIADRLEVTGVDWFALDRLPDVSEPTLDILRGVGLL
jgi:ADP-ribose pyrophosphatase YjhB (NUDIX family)